MMRVKYIASAWLAAVASCAAAAAPSDRLTASVAEQLVPGQHLAQLDASPYLVQRLSERIYFLRVSGYNSTLVVGRDGVLLIDPLGKNAAPHVRAAIASVTNLPIKALLYSHHHLDHIGGASAFVREARASGTELRVYATATTHAEIERFGRHVPAPTDVLDARHGRFTFDGIAVEIMTPEISGHSRDSAIIRLPDEHVVHFTDAFDPTWTPFVDFGLAQDVAALEQNLLHLQDMDWNFLNTGHGNVGSKADVASVLAYIADVRASVTRAIALVKYEEFEKPGIDHIAVFNEYTRAISAPAVRELRAKYGQQYGFEAAAPSQVRMMLHQLLFSGG